MEGITAAGSTAARWARRVIADTLFLRRRVAVLALGMAVLGLVSWAGNGALALSAAWDTAAGTAGLSAGAQRPGTGHGSGATAGAARQAHGTGSAAPGSGVPGTAAVGRDLAALQHHPTARPADEDLSTGNVLAPSSSGSTLAAGPGGMCPTADVVLSVFSATSWYTHGELPEFVVAAVSTAPWPCRFNTGPRFLSVAVTSGRTATWNSAGCASHPGSRVVTLVKGRPDLTWVTWDRRTGGGCQQGGPFAQRGTYTATAIGQHQRSTGLVFVLAGRHTPVP
jgi:hypothetical protein